MRSLIRKRSNSDHLAAACTFDRKSSSHPNEFPHPVLSCATRHEPADQPPSSAHQQPIISPSRNHASTDVPSPGRKGFAPPVHQHTAAEGVVPHHMAARNVMPPHHSLGVESRSCHHTAASRAGLEESSPVRPHQLRRSRQEPINLRGMPRTPRPKWARAKYERPWARDKVL
jgi:hypothetical protein